VYSWWSTQESVQLVSHSRKCKLVSHSRKCTVGEPLKKVYSWWATQEILPILRKAKGCAVFTRASPESPSWAKWIHCTAPHPITFRATLILFCHLRVCLLSGHFLSTFPTKTLYTLRFSSMPWHVPPISFSRFAFLNQARSSKHDASRYVFSVRRLIMFSLSTALDKPKSVHRGTLLTWRINSATPKAAIGQDPEPAPSTSLSHNLFI
jgi:hypothetical protein